MSPVKIPFVFLAALFNHISTTPPVPPPQPDELLKDVPFGERIFVKTVRSVTGIAKLLVWAGSLCEVAVLLARANPSFELAQRVLSALVVEPGSENRLRISRIFVLGCMLGALGGFIRIQCYRTLGRFFTYELTLRNNHRLVTSGPYAVVRHPSYIGLIVGSGCGLCLDGVDYVYVGPDICTVLVLPPLDASAGIILNQTYPSEICGIHQNNEDEIPVYDDTD
ncbi:hypothetical protein A0H81_12475 [Grifola frondosa]|uniref:Protein-S-isoprenylcysteine O-methyltransferase n=1 Tax=Grifola frondosa TaxID=5627 RepID=A0A1C7LXL3_GRIFR|nr:hypothetical protein A0H81_12475 [Grifola frondosa]